MNLLVNEDATKEFINKVVPSIEKDEVLIAVIVARKKYGGVSRSEELLDKLILKNSDVNYILRKLRKFAYVDKTYIDFKTGEYIRPESMALYIDLHPKSALKAYNIFSSDIMKWIYQKLNSEDFDDRIFRKIDTKLFSAIARATSRKPYYLIDIDRKKEYILDKVIKYLDRDIRWITETRGGYHVIANNINPEKRLFLKDRKIYLQDDKEQKYLFMYDDKFMSEDVEIFYYQCQTPVVGSMQGGFEVRKVC